MKKPLIAIGLIALVGFGIWYGYNQYKKLTGLCFNFAGFELSKINRERITLIIKLNVRNKSDIPIELSAYNFNAYMNGIYVANVNSVNPVTGNSLKLNTIAPNKFSVLSLLIDIEPKKIKGLGSWEIISKILLDVNNIKIKIAGSVSASIAGFGIKNFPVEIESKLKDMLPKKGAPSEPCQ